ncbi:MAG: hypothetical protein MZV70_16740 [Desulfobacterales bacterium]|nr:hypothetical protein [Desulfobacterales bacterium]
MLVIYSCLQGIKPAHPKRGEGLFSLGILMQGGEEFTHCFLAIFTVVLPQRNYAARNLRGSREGMRSSLRSCGFCLRHHVETVPRYQCMRRPGRRRRASPPGTAFTHL